MSEGERPIPVPRPRQIKSIDETDRSSQTYENYALPAKKNESPYDSLNAQLSEIKSDAVHRPVPVPRAKGIAAVSKRNYENSPDTARLLNNDQQKAEQSLIPTGAIRKATIISNVRNSFDNPEPVVVRTSEERTLKDTDALSQASSASEKSGSDSKFATPSPG